jgi:probable HAF family extracellular repeat protein
MAVGAAATASASTAGAAAGAQIGPTNSWALVVNDHGDVAGELGGVSANSGFFWHDGKLTNLGSLSNGGDVEVRGLNEYGAVVGEAQAGPLTWHAFAWSDGKLTDLGTAGVNSSAIAVNDQGQVIGTSETAAGQTNAVVWRNGRMTTLPSLGGDSEPRAENSAGVVVGSSQTGTAEWHAVVWSKGKLTDLGPGDARAVNNSGQVLVWRYSATVPASAFLWHDGVKTALPSDVFSVNGLNDKGQVVGTYGSSGSEGFVWSKGKLTDLGAFDPLAINDRGQSVGYLDTASGTLGGVEENGTTTTLSPTSGTTDTPEAISNTGLVAGLNGAPMSATTWHVPSTR